MKPGISRRTFLTGLAAGIAGGIIGLRIHFHRGTGPGTGDAKRLAGLIDHTDSAVLLGRFYLDGVPQEADPAHLVDLIGAAPEPAPPTADAGAEESLRRRVAEQIRADFLSDNTVAVDGWLLALTEARLCALVSLLHDAQPVAART
jgi:hypothetical protein